MMNLLFVNTGKFVRRVYNYQRFPVFNRIKDFLSKKTKEEPIKEIKSKDKLIVIDEGLTEFEKSHKDIKDSVVEEDETKKIKGKIKKTKKKKVLTAEEEAFLKEKGEIFQGKLKIKPKDLTPSIYKESMNLLKKEEKIRQKFQKDKELIDELINDIKLEKASQQLIELRPEREVLSIYKKLEITEEFADGSIALLEIFDENGNPIKFENKKKYQDWKERQLLKMKKQIKYKLNPREEWILQHKGLELPRTGEYWDLNKVGLYACKVCTQRLFSSTHKYDSKCGHATFWNYLPYTLDFKDDHLTPYPEPTQSVIPINYQKSNPVKRISCSNCESHIGLVFNDGPAPFFKRLLVNSSAVKFLDIGWFESPDEKRLRKKIQRIKNQEIKEQEEDDYIEIKEKQLDKLVKNLQETIEIENQLNHEKLMSNFKEYQRRLNELKQKEKSEAKKVEEPQQIIENKDDTREELTK